MTSLTDDLFSQLSGPALQQIAGQLGAGQAQTAGAVAALATVLPAARQPQAAVTLAPREAPEGGGGYALTEHVKRYYRTAGV